MTDKEEITKLVKRIEFLEDQAREFAAQINRFGDRLMKMEKKNYNREGE